MFKTFNENYSLFSEDYLQSYFSYCQKSTFKPALIEIKSFLKDLHFRHWKRVWVLYFNDS